MVNESILCWFPGLEYTSKGPIWIDKITIRAFQGSKALSLEIPISPNVRKQVGLEVSLYTADCLFNADDPTRSLYYTYADTNFGGMLKHKLYHVLNGKVCPDFKNLNQNNIGLCCVEYDWRLNTNITFMIDLYTCIDWQESSSQTYYQIDFTDSQLNNYKIIDTVVIEYNPFTHGNYVIPISGIDLSEYAYYEEPSISKKVILNNSQNGLRQIDIDKLVISSNKKDTGAMSIDFSNIYSIPTLTYNELPTVPIIHTNPAKRQCFSKLDDTIRLIQKKLGNYDDFNLCVFGPLNSNDLAESNAAFIGNVKSENSEIGKQRYSALYINHGTYDLGASLFASYTIGIADLNDLFYFYSIPPELKTSVSISNQKSVFSQPRDLYSTDISNKIITFNSGCSLSALKNRVPSSVSDKQLYIWSDWTNVRLHTGVPTNLQNTKASSPIEESDSLSLSLYNTDAVELTASVTWPSLLDVGFVTFVDTNTTISKISDKVTNAYNTHFGNFRQYKAQITPILSTFEYSASFDLKAQLEDPNNNYQSDFTIIPYYQFVYTTEQNEQASYLVGDSLYGSVENVSAVGNVTIMVDGAITQKNNVTSWFFNQSDPPAQDVYIIKPDTTGTITIKSGTPAEQCYLVKWNQAILYTNGEVDVSASEKYPYNMTIVQLDSSGEASFQLRNDSSGDLYLSKQIGVFEFSDTAETYEHPTNEDYDYINKFISNNIVFKHCFAAYEETILFKSGIFEDYPSGLTLQNIYFPPAALYCIGYYKSMNTDIDIENVKFINQNTPMKSQAMLEELVKQTFKYPKI